MTTDRLAALLTEVTARANTVVHEQDAIDFIDWCRDDLPILAATPQPAPDALRAAAQAVVDWAYGPAGVHGPDWRVEPGIMDRIDALRAALGDKP